MSVIVVIVIVVAFIVNVTVEQLNKNTNKHG